MIQLIINFLLSLFKRPQAPVNLTDPLRIERALVKRNDRIAKNPGEVNIVYVEGADMDLSPNTDAPDKWNDVRLVLQYVNGEPQITGKWQATSEPGRHFTENKLNPKGAARIALGQHKNVWQVGMHRENHEALVQTGGTVLVFRDGNKDYEREGDFQDTGWFGINQHWGYDYSEDSIKTASAGCLVGRTKEGHKAFMAIVKSDPRYKANKQFKFDTTVISSQELK